MNRTQKLGNVLIISSRKRMLSEFQSYLHSVLGEYLTFNTLLREQATDPSLFRGYQCVLFPSVRAMETFPLTLDSSILQLPCDRVFNHMFLDKIIQIPPHERVYLVNDDKYSTLAIISQLEECGITQYLSGINVNDDTVPFLEVYSDDKTSCVVIKVADNSAFDMGELNNPRRLYIDVQKDYEYSITKELEPGLTQISYYSKKSGVKQHAQLVEVSPKYFKFVPVLGGGDKMAKNTVSAMSDYVNAVVAENASYFGSGKELYGVTKIAGDLVSSMYLTRTGFGVLADGTPYIGDVSYSGIVQSKNGDVYVYGLNGTRTSDSVMLYNQYYGKSTGTDNSGIEYVVKDNKIVKINSGNSLLRSGEIVVSATGNGKNILSGLNVGDDLIVNQILNTPWDSATDILGVGPRLVKNGQVDITSSIEQIGPDVTGARAPRTAVGILKNGNVLFAVLDGRQAHSKGMMLDEFARFLIGMEVVDAVNFDGGGSSELVIGGKIVNSPSDGMERPVATALTAVRR